MSQCSVVCCSICCVSCSIAVGEDWETLQPTTGGDLWAHQVRQRTHQNPKCTNVFHKHTYTQNILHLVKIYFCSELPCNTKHVSTGNCRGDLGFRWVSEQVSHHPPVSAFQAEGLEEDFVFHGSICPKLKFWGKSIEAEPKGIITLELPKWVHSQRLLR